MAGKCTCPECKVTFSPPNGVGKIKCPMCKARITLSGNGKASGAEERSGGGRQLAAIAIMVAVLLFLLVGAGLGLYVLSASRDKPTAEVAKVEDRPKVTETPAPTPGAAPDVIASPCYADPAP